MLKRQGNTRGDGGKSSVKKSKEAKKLKYIMKERIIK
jgi:hypothetical protein